MADESVSAKRPTGSIPLSWARPAEDVSTTVEPVSHVPVLSVLGLVAVVVIIAVVLISLRPTVPATTPSVTSSLPTPTKTTPTPTPTPTPTTTPAPIAAAPEPARSNPAIAPEDDDAVSGSGAKAAPTTNPPKDPPTSTAAPVAQKYAQQLLRAARLAARDNDNAKAIALTEDAVDKDPRCYECWSTLAFLRNKTGDVDGARAARAQARAVAPR